jgi:hypothetical protein
VLVVAEQTEAVLGKDGALDGTVCRAERREPVPALASAAETSKSGP